MAASKNHANCWAHKDFPYTANNVETLREAFEASGGKDECQVRVTGIKREYWMGTSIGRLGGYGFQGAVTAGDGSNKKGDKMGARFINLRRKKRRGQKKVGHEEEGSSSNRPELAALVEALRGTQNDKPMLYLCDNQALLKAVMRWVGEGGKATLAGAPDADILREAIELLRARIEAGTATFLVKVKAHRGEPANEEADILADKAISDELVPKEWCKRTSRAVFTWREPRRSGGKVSYEDRKATWNNGVRKAIRRGAAENEVQKHRELMTGAWKKISTQRRRFEVNYDPGLLEILQKDTWRNDKDFEKTCVRKRTADKKHPASTIWNVGCGFHAKASLMMRGGSFLENI